MFAISSFNMDNFLSSPSRFIASRSISNCIILRSISSNASGTESISKRNLEAASSIKSMALSGKKRSEI